MDVAEEKWNTKGLPMWEGWSGARQGIPVYDTWLDDYKEELGLFDSNPGVIELGVRQARTVSLFFCLLAFSHAVAAVCRGGRESVCAHVRHAGNLVPGEDHLHNHGDEADQ